MERNENRKEFRRERVLHTEWERKKRKPMEDAKAKLFVFRFRFRRPSSELNTTCFDPFRFDSCSGCLCIFGCFRIAVELSCKSNFVHVYDAEVSQPGVAAWLE